jgi:hypothetical protein
MEDGIHYHFLTLVILASLLSKRVTTRNDVNPPNKPLSISCINM